MTRDADNSHRTYTFCQAFFAQLARLGVRSAVVSPGSRSTPLALCSQVLSQAVVLDERSAGFVALGMAKATRTPVVLICTSGTAAANYLPAVVEAAHAGVPLLVLTADRPMSVRQWGASQTIDQSRLYGDHAGWFSEVIAPAGNVARAGSLLAQRAFARASRGAPVHLNWPLDKPLEPPNDFVVDEAGWEAGMEADMGTDADADFGARAADAAANAAADAVAAKKLSKQVGQRGVLVVGGCDLDEPAAQAVVRFAEAAGWPILSEATSGLRFGAGGSDTASTNTASTNTVLGNGHFLCQNRDLLPQPEVVVRVGPNPLDVALQDFLRHNRPTLTLDMADSWSDPEFLSQEFHHGNLADIFSLAAESISGSGSGSGPGAGGHDWLALWQRADEAAGQAIAAVLAGDATQGLSQAQAVRILAGSLEDGDLVYVASSFAIRDFEIFAGARSAGAGAGGAGSAGARSAGVRVLANRGANGIDGMVSSAIGAAVGSGRPVTLLLGDLALLHDMGALVLAAQLGVVLRVLVFNNNGGGIFTQLPVAEAVPAEIFSRLFITPHDLDFGFLGALPGVEYGKVSEPSELRAVLGGRGDSPGDGQDDETSKSDKTAVQIWEVPCKSSTRSQQLDNCRQAVRNALERALPTDSSASSTSPNSPASPALKPAHIPPFHFSEHHRQKPHPQEPATHGPTLPPGPTPKLHATQWSTAGRQSQQQDIPLVLLHGFMGSVAAMRPLVGELFHRHKVIAVDLPGHGKSLMPQVPDWFDPEAASQLFWQALDERGVEQAHLVGYSMGGRLALCAALQQPERIASVVCLGATPGIADPHEREQRRQQDDRKANALLADGLEKFLDDWLAQPLFASLSQKMSPQEFEAYRQLRLGCDPENLALSLRHMGTGSMAPLHDQLAAADFDCLWLAGQDDQKYRAIALEMAQAMPRGSTAVIADAGHAVHVENLAETARLISNFLASLDLP